MVSLRILILLLIGNTAFSQLKSDSLKIEFLFPFSVVRDSSQLNLTVIYKNITRKDVFVYQILKEGDKGDRFFNINIQMEKLEGKKFRPCVLRFYQNPLLYRMEDSLRHFDLPRKRLAPSSSDTLYLNLSSIARGFQPGKYRFRIFLRVGTIRDERKYDDRNLETEPPMDKILYSQSKWFYLLIKNQIKDSSIMNL